MIFSSRRDYYRIYRPPQAKKNIKYNRISVPIAVVGCRPDGDNLVVEHPLVALHNKLVGTADVVDVVSVIKRGDDIAPKEVASPTWTQPPLRHGVLRVRP